ncbi:TolC family outer membrane protein [Oceanobacter mangrovi]|uniref:TolC family outer membrane protein n=1 Tax=Oceanobacter mangrovi TaxID=2862510 RepID=UPI001C8D3F73|nr:TolC family outer membrane protein [Oceanobacter mangrovi]
MAPTSALSQAATCQPGAACSQQSGWADTSITSLSSAVQRALEHDATLSTARQQRQVVRFQTDQARAPLLPQLSLQLDYNQYSERGRGLTGSSQSGYSDYEIRSLSASLQQSLFNAGDWYRYQAALSADRQAAMTLQAAQQDLLLRTSSAWFNTLRQQDLLATLESELEALQQSWQQSRRRHEAGLVVSLEVQEARARIDQTLATLVQARNDLQLARLQLQQLTGVTIAALPSLGTVRVLEDKSQQQWLALATGNSLELQQAGLSQQQAVQDRQASRMDLLPNVTLNAGISREVEDAWRYSDDGTGTPLDTNSRYIGIQVSVPLYQGGGSYAASRAAAATLAERQQQLRLQQQLLETGVLSLYAQLQNQQASIDARQQALTSANATLAATEAAWNTGLRRFIDVLNARQARYDAERELAASRYDYLISWLSLHRVAGTLDSEVIAELDSAIEPQHRQGG